MLQGQILASKVIPGEPQKTAHNIQESVENSRMFSGGGIVHAWTEHVIG